MGIDTAAGTQDSRQGPRDGDGQAAGGSVAATPARALGRFEHRAFFYRDTDEFLTGALSFIATGLEASEPVLVAVSQPRARSIEQDLGDERERVRFVDVQTVGRNPARMLPLWREFRDDHAADGLVPRAVSELAWPGRTRAELCECDRNESLLNLAFADGHAWALLCAYDLAALDDCAVETARRRHTPIERDDETSADDSHSPDGALAIFDGSLPAPATAPERIEFSASDLACIRALMTQRATSAQLARDAGEDLVLAINELLSNSVQYGGGGGELLIWNEADALLCEVRDRGQISDPLAGRVRPRRDQSGGRGLWLVNQLCDLVQIRVSRAGTVVRVHVDLP